MKTVFAGWMTDEYPDDLANLHVSCEVVGGEQEAGYSIDDTGSIVTIRKSEKLYQILFRSPLRPEHYDLEINLSPIDLQGKDAWTYGVSDVDSMNDISVAKLATQDKVVAYFDKDGSVRCQACLSTPFPETNTVWDGVWPTKIFESNLTPYSQFCHYCHQTVFKGPAPNILFEQKLMREQMLPPYGVKK